jgi:hypothetical protein
MLVAEGHGSVRMPVRVELDLVEGRIKPEGVIHLWMSTA